MRTADNLNLYSTVQLRSTFKKNKETISKWNEKLMRIENTFRKYNKASEDEKGCNQEVKNNRQ